MRLTDISVRTLTPPPSGYKLYYDDVLRNFGIRVTHRGTKTWFYIDPGPNARRSIGRYPEISLKEARSIALEEIAAAKERTEETTQSALYLETVDKFLEAVADTLAPSTQQQYRRYLSRHFPWGNDELGGISPGKVTAALDALKGYPSAQRYAYAALHAFFNWANERELVDKNPVHNVTPPPVTGSRERVLSDAELRAVLQAAQHQETTFSGIMQLLILTGQRRSEVSALEWDWIDWDERLITFPANAVKNRTQHYLPLGDWARRLLEQQPHQSPYVFPARVRRAGVAVPFSGWSKAKLSFDRHLEGVAPYTLHDLRRTFASTLAMLGTPIHITEKLLNHRSGSHSGIVGVYQRYEYMEERRHALAVYEEYLANLINT